jgi:hypothetical protein
LGILESDSDMTGKIPVVGKNKNPPPFGRWQRVPKESGLCFLAILASESQPTTRCLDANDGWHDGVRRGDAIC